MSKALSHVFGGLEELHDAILPRMLASRWRIGSCWVRFEVPAAPSGART